MPGSGAPVVRVRGVGPGIALVDGVPLYREGLTALIRRTPGLRWLGSADSPQGAVQLVERFRPGILLVDSGVDPRNHLGQLLCSAHPAVAVLVLVRDRHRTTNYVATALSTGAHGVLLRSAEPARVLEAIAAVHRDRRYVDPGLAQVVAPPQGRAAGLGQPLSRREFQVLQLMADGLENQAIATVLFVSVETVRTHVKSILRKLTARDRTHAVAVAFRSGVLGSEHAPGTADQTGGAPRTGT